MSNRLEAGLNAIERGNFLEAIKLLEEYCQEYELNSQGSFREYIQALDNTSYILVCKSYYQIINIVYICNTYTSFIFWMVAFV